MSGIIFALLYFGIAGAAIVSGGFEDSAIKMFLVLGNVWMAAHWLNKQARERIQ